ncbi:MAG: flavodoxin II [Cognaticolwellia sp.]|jgi:flavodoxin II
MKIGIYYATTSGNTEVVSDYLINFLGDDLATKHDISDNGFVGIEQCDLVIFGTPTWDYGHLQSDWEDLWESFLELDLKNTTVALYGLGDQFGYPEWYLDAMGMIHDELLANGVKIIGKWPVKGYEFEASKAVTPDGKHFVGLALDEESQGALTEDRVSVWCCEVLEIYAETVI